MNDLISRQAAIDAILHITNCKSVRELFEYNQLHHLTEMWSGGVNDAIDAVIGVDSAQLGTNLAQLGTDTISRQAAIDALHMHLMYRMGTDSNKKRLDEWINNLPSAEPTVEAIPVEWIKKYAEEHHAYIHEFRNMLAEWAERKEE